MELCLWSNCNQVFESTSSLYKHVHVLHVADRKTGFEGFCRWLGCTQHEGVHGRPPYKKPSDLASHMLVHINYRPFECVCGTSSKRPYDHQKHVHACATSRAFSSSSPPSANSHHSNSNKKPWSAEMCRQHLLKNGIDAEVTECVMRIVKDGRDLADLTEDQLIQAGLSIYAQIHTVLNVVPHLPNQPSSMIAPDTLAAGGGASTSSLSGAASTSTKRSPRRSRSTSPTLLPNASSDDNRVDVTDLGAYPREQQQQQQQQRRYANARSRSRSPPLLNYSEGYGNSSAPPAVAAAAAAAAAPGFEHRGRSTSSPLPQFSMAQFQNLSLSDNEHASCEEEGDEEFEAGFDDEHQHPDAHHQGVRQQHASQLLSNLVLSTDTELATMTMLENLIQIQNGSSSTTDKSLIDLTSAYFSEAWADSNTDPASTKPRAKLESLHPNDAGNAAGGDDSLNRVTSNIDLSVLGTASVPYDDADQKAFMQGLELVKSGGLFSTLPLDFSSFEEVDDSGSAYSTDYELDSPHSSSSSSMSSSSSGNSNSNSNNNKRESAQLPQHTSKPTSPQSHSPRSVSPSSVLFASAISAGIAGLTLNRANSPPHSGKKSKKKRSRGDQNQEDGVEYDSDSSMNSFLSDEEDHRAALVHQHQSQHQSQSQPQRSPSSLSMDSATLVDSMSVGDMMAEDTGGAAAAATAAATASDEADAQFQDSEELHRPKQQRLESSSPSSLSSWSPASSSSSDASSVMSGHSAMEMPLRSSLSSSLKSSVSSTGADSVSNTLLGPLSPAEGSAPIFASAVRTAISEGWIDTVIRDMVAQGGAAHLNAGTSSATASSSAGEMASSGVSSNVVKGWDEFWRSCCDHIQVVLSGMNEVDQLQAHQEFELQLELLRKEQPGLFTVDSEAIQMGSQFATDMALLLEQQQQQQQQQQATLAPPLPSRKRPISSTSLVHAQRSKSASDAASESGVGLALLLQEDHPSHTDGVIAAANPNRKKLPTKQSSLSSIVGGMVVGGATAAASFVSGVSRNLLNPGTSTLPPAPASPLTFASSHATASLPATTPSSSGMFSTISFWNSTPTSLLTEASTKASSTLAASVDGLSSSASVIAPSTGATSSSSSSTVFDALSVSSTSLSKLSVGVAVAAAVAMAGSFVARRLFMRRAEERQNAELGAAPADTRPAPVH